MKSIHNEALNHKLSKSMWCYLIFSEFNTIADFIQSGQFLLNIILNIYDKMKIIENGKNDEEEEYLSY